METKRRDFLKTTGALLASTSLPMLSMFPGKANAAITPNPKKLVVLLLQGGNDGMNTIIPTDAVNYPLYQALRPDIGIDKELTTHFGDAANGVPMSLHPAFDGLLEMHADKFAVFPATHSGPFSNTSHFYQYDFFGGGLYVGQQYTADGKGWIGRHLDKKYETPAEGITAYDFTGGQFKLTRGNSFVLGLSNPRNLNLGTTEANGFKIWDEIKGFTDPAGVNSQSKYAAEQTNLFESVFPRLKGEVDFDRIPTTADYPTASVGTNFKRTADMLLGMPELEVVHISYGGFDTHRNQVTGGDTTSGRHANILTNVADSLSAFYDDLFATNQALHDNVTVVVMTEFGRTAKQNNNLGTDHAQASCWMAFGPHVKGGIYGDYPGLASTQLESGRYLKQTVDYRDILSEIMGPKGMGLPVADANNLFPSYNGTTDPLGFMV